MKTETQVVGERFAQELINLHRNYETRISRLENLIEDLLDARSLQDAIERKEETLPDAMVKRLIAKESPLRVWREHRDMSQTALAKKSGVSQNMLSAIEAGTRKGSVDTLKALAEALEIDLDDIA